MADAVVPKKKKRNITLEMKKTLITDYNNGLNGNAISRKYKLPYTTVIHIINAREKILSAFQNHPKNAYSVRGSIGVQRKMETLLKSWCEKQLEGVPLNQKVIQTKAVQIFEKLKLESGNPQSRNAHFNPSTSWYKRFRSRCSDLPWDKLTKKSDTWLPEKIRTKIDEGGYCDQTVFSVCESMLYWKRFPKISDPHSKAFLGLILGGNAAGDCKLKPVVVYHSENPQLLKSKSKAGPVIWKTDPKCAITPSLFEDWFGHYFIPEVERFCYSQNIPFKVLLILPSDKCDPNMTLADFDTRVNIVYVSEKVEVSENIVHHLPMEQGIISTFKAIYIKHMLERMVQYNINLHVSWKELNMLDAVRAIGESWSEVSKTTFRAAWNKLCANLFQTPCPSINSQIGETVSDIEDLAKKIGFDLNSDEVKNFINEPVIIFELESHDFMVHHGVPGKEKVMAIEKLIQGIDLIEDGLRIFEEIDADKERLNAARQGVQKAIACYTEMMQQQSTETIEDSPPLPDASILF